MLTQLQRDAMTRAQAGDWRLADAIELLAEGRRDYDCESLIGGIAVGGRLQFFVYGNATPCEDCDNGKVECDRCNKGQATCAECGHVGPCEECNSTGFVSCDSCDGDGESGASLERDSGDWRYVLNLNEDVVYDHNVDDISDTPPHSITLTPAAARAIVANYEKELSDAATSTPEIQPALVTEGALAA